jgi:hypothetical protein
MRIANSKPCDDCPFLTGNAASYGLPRLRSFASGAFPCHKTARLDERSDAFRWTNKSKLCAGALIFNERRGEITQAMQIAERLFDYAPEKLDLNADVLTDGGE